MAEGGNRESHESNTDGIAWFFPHSCYSYHSWFNPDLYNVIRGSPRENGNNMGRKTTKKAPSSPDSTASAHPVGPAAAAIDERLLNTRELMEFMNLSRTKIWDLVNNHGLPAFRVGGDYRYLRSEVLAWLQQHRVRSGSQESEAESE